MASHPATTVAELIERKRQLTAELRQIDGEYVGRDLPPDVWRRWHEMEEELDALEQRICNQLAEAENAVRR